MVDELTDAGVYVAESAAIDRLVQVGIASGRVLQVSFPADRPDDASSEHPILSALLDYLEDGNVDEIVDVDVALTMPTDRRGVLETLRTVPPGEEVTTEQLARMTTGLDPDEPEDLGLVERALADNPAPILVPDHRVADAGGATPGDVRRYCREIEGV